MANHIQDIDGEGHITAGRDINLNNVLPLTPEQQEQKEKEEMGIVYDILHYIFTNRIPNIEMPSPENDNSLMELKEKIKLNFQEQNILAISSTIRNLWHKKEVVKKFFETEKDPDQINSLKDLIQSDFREIRETHTHNDEINSIEVIHKIALLNIPERKKRNAEYIAIAKSIVLYFFELCDIGKRTDTENSQELTLFP